MTPTREAAVVATGPGAQALEAGPSTRHLTLSLDGQRCALAIAPIREILEVPALTPVPMVPDVVRGVMNLRGSVVPVIDLAVRVGLGRTPVARRSCVVIVESGEGRARQALGLLVEAVHEVAEIPGGSIEPVPEIGTRIDPGFLDGIARSGGRLLMVLDLERVLAEDELLRLVASPAAH
jgi:purine-binding chemotaxis protein CheW